MFEAYCEDYLASRSDRVVLSVGVKLLSRSEAGTAAVGESPAADRISDLLDLENPTVATYAKEDGVLIRVTASAADHDAALALAMPVVHDIEARFTGFVKQIVPDA